MSAPCYFQFLGTGAGDANYGSQDTAGVPQKDLRRYACNYLSPDLLIDFNEHTSGAMVEYGIAPESIRYLLISHGHYDHFQPVEIIRFAASLPHPLKVFGNSMVVDALEFCRDNAFDDTSGRFVERQGQYNLETVRLTVGSQATVGGVHVTPVLGNHFMNKPYCIMEQQALNFLIQINGKTVFYGLDSSYTIPQTMALLTGTHLDVAIVDATFGPLEIDPVISGHHNWSMLDETLAEMRAAGCVDEDTTIVADHLSVRNVGPHELVADELVSKGMILAYDGMKLSI